MYGTAKQYGPILCPIFHASLLFYWKVFWFQLIYFMMSGYQVNIILEIYLSFYACIFTLNLVHSSYIPQLVSRGKQDELSIQVIENPIHLS